MNRHRHTTNNDQIPIKHKVMLDGKAYDRRSLEKYVQNMINRGMEHLLKVPHTGLPMSQNVVNKFARNIDPITHQPIPIKYKVVLNGKAYDRRSLKNYVQYMINHGLEHELKVPHTGLSMPSTVIDTYAASRPRGVKGWRAYVKRLTENLYRGLDANDAWGHH
jgi:uncharacterized protein YprB with RNaseH-like and TPR domain